MNIHAILTARHLLLGFLAGVLLLAPLGCSFSKSSSDSSESSSASSASSSASSSPASQESLYRDDVRDYVATLARSSTVFAQALPAERTDPARRAVRPPLRPP
jgi:hypothetical protein